MMTRKTTLDTMSDQLVGNYHMVVGGALHVHVHVHEEEALRKSEQQPENINVEIIPSQNQNESVTQTTLLQGIRKIVLTTHIQNTVYQSPL